MYKLSDIFKRKKKENKLCKLWGKKQTFTIYQVIENKTVLNEKMKLILLKLFIYLIISQKKTLARLID